MIFTAKFANWYIDGRLVSFTADVEYEVEPYDPGGWDQPSSPEFVYDLECVEVRDVQGSIANRRVVAEVHHRMDSSPEFLADLEAQAMQDARDRTEAHWR